MATLIKPVMIDVDGGLDTYILTIVSGVPTFIAASGAVDSVNGQTGVVVLDLNDLDDVPAYPNDGYQYVLVEESGVLTWELYGGGASAVETVVGGTNVTVDASDPLNPIVNLDDDIVLNSTSTTVQYQTAITTLVDGANISWDWALGNIAEVTLTDNRTLDAATNLNVGTWLLKVVQDATGSRTLTFDASYVFPNGTPALRTDPNAEDWISFVCDGTAVTGVYLNPPTGAELSKQSFISAASDETTDLVVGTNLIEYTLPYNFTLTGVRATLTEAATGGLLTVDINRNAVSILSTLITLDSGEKTSETAATPPVISTASLSNSDIITVDLDVVGSTAAGKGLKIYLIGYATDNLLFSGLKLQLASAYSDENVTDLVADTLVPVWSKYIGEGFTLSDWLFDVITAPVGASITFDVHKNGTTIFSVKPTIASAANTSTGAVLSTTTFDVGDLCEVFVDTVGSSTAGKGAKGNPIGVIVP